MPRLDDLPPDLRATLSLLVDRGKSYAQVAELLGIPESAVRDRAHAALDALAGAPGGRATSSPAGRSAPARSAPPELESSAGAGQAARGAGAGHASGVATAGLPMSKRGGATLLAGIVVVVIVVVVLLTSGGGGGGSSTNAGTNASASTTTPAHTKSSSTTSSKSKSSKKAKATVTNQLRLAPPDPSSKAIGIVEILAEGSQHAAYVAAEHLPPTHGFFYVLWLYNSPSSARAIGKTSVGSTERLQAGALLPANASEYHQILLARETDEHSTSPGPTVLSGPFSLNK